MSGPTRAAPVAFLGPPVAWALHVMLVYPLAPLVCGLGSRWPFWLAHLGCGSLAGVATLVSFRLLRRIGRPSGPEEVAVGRTRFLARLGVFSGVFFLFVIVLEALPTVLQDPCR